MRKMWHTLVKEPNQLNSPDLADYREMMVAQTPIKPRQHPLATFTVPSQAESVQEEETNEEEKKDLKMEASSDFVDVADDAASVDFSGEGFETCYGEPPGSLGTEEEEAKDMSDAKAQRDADEEQNERKEEEEVISESAVTMDKAHQEEEIKQEMERIDFSAKVSSFFCKLLSSSADFTSLWPRKTWTDSNKLCVTSRHCPLKKRRTWRSSLCRYLTLFYQGMVASTHA